MSNKNNNGQSIEEYTEKVHKRKALLSGLLLVAVAVIFWQASVVRALRIEVEALRSGEEAPQTNILGGVNAVPIETDLSE